MSPIDIDHLFCLLRINSHSNKDPLYKWIKIIIRINILGYHNHF